MPFGLASALAMFCRLMRKLFANEKNVKTYLDNICIHSKSIKEHKEHLRRCLQIIKLAGLSLNIKKCRFFQRRVELLGYKVTVRRSDHCRARWKQ